MTPKFSNPVVRWMPSLTDVAFLMPIVFLFTRMQGVKSMLGDGDTGWHIRAGEWMLANRRIADQDMFSFTKPGEPWFAWEWLWDIAFGALHRSWGMAAVVSVSILVICATFALLYRLVASRCLNPAVAIGITVLAMAGSTVHWLARPHLFTMLFTVIFLTILDGVHAGKAKLLLWLPPLTILWTNLHGGFIVEIIVLGCYGAGELARAAVAVDATDRRFSLGASVPYFVTAIACTAASLINPYSWQLHVHIWRYLSDTETIRTISEFQGTNFQNGGIGFFEVMLLLGVGAAIWYGARKHFAQVLLLAVWGHGALIAIRNVPLFMIVAAPSVAVALSNWLHALADAPVAAWLRNLAANTCSIGEELIPLESMRRVHLIGVAGMALVVAGMFSSSAGPLLRPEYDSKTYPAKALAVLMDPDLRVFTNDEWGDYLIYMLAPSGSKVYVDGRSDFYGAKFSKEYVELLNVKYDWERTLAHFAVDTILLPPDAPLASAVKESRHWRVVYDDGAAIVFRQNRAAPHQVFTGSPGEEPRSSSAPNPPDVNLGGSNKYVKGVYPL